MRKPGGSERSLIEEQYGDWIKHCNLNLKQLDENLPPPVYDFQDVLKERGITRRDFLKWTSMVTASLLLPSVLRPQVAKAAELFNRLPVVWLSFAECTGCAEAFLRSSYPSIDEMLIETISLEYQENLMAAAGYQAEENLEKCTVTFPANSFA